MKDVRKNERTERLHDDDDAAAADDDNDDGDDDDDDDDDVHCKKIIPWLLYNGQSHHLPLLSFP